MVIVLKDALRPFQKAVFELLDGDSGVTDLAPVVDKVPQNGPYPFIWIGDLAEREWRSNTSPGSEILFSVHVWSDYKGNSEVLLIKNELDRLLGDIIDLTIDDFDLNYCMVDGSQITRETTEGGITLRHLTRRYRAKVQQQ